MSQTEPVVGVDLGPTNSCVAAMDGNAPKVIPNRGGYRKRVRFTFTSTDRISFFAASLEVSFEFSVICDVWGSIFFQAAFTNDSATLIFRKIGQENLAEAPACNG